MLLTTRFAIPCLSISVATFGRVVAGLITDFLGYPVIREVFGSKAECKTRVQGFALNQECPQSWQHEKDAWKDLGFYGVTHGHCK